MFHVPGFIDDQKFLALLVLISVTMGKREFEIDYIVQNALQSVN